MPNVILRNNALHSRRKSMPSSVWGKELIVDAKKARPSLVSDPEELKRFAAGLVKVAEMEPHGDPILEHFAEGTDLAGWTIVQLIVTSSLVIHACDQSKDIYLNLFTCGELKMDKTVSWIREQFEAEDFFFNIICRGA